eukprot:gene9730-9796_t
MRHGPEALHARLAEVDPVSAARLGRTDSQRIARAWEVWRSTGKGIASWQAQTQTPAPWRFRVILLDPPRDILRAAIAQRFDGMIAAGAIDEVRALMKFGLDPGLPAMRAVGVPELAAYLRAEITLQEACARATRASGQYIKRQATWFRNQKLVDPARLHTIHARTAGLEQFSERESTDLLNFRSAPFYLWRIMTQTETLQTAPETLLESGAENGRAAGLTDEGLVLV